MELYSKGPSVPGCLDPLILTQEGASLILEKAAVLAQMLDGGLLHP